MELIINLIIVFIIIFSILRRVQEVGKKGEEIKVPPDIPPESLSEQIKELKNLMQPELEEVTQVSEPVLTEEGAIEKVHAEFTEPEVAPEPETPALFEEPVPVVEEQIPVIVEPVPMIKQPVSYKKITPRKKVSQRYILSFGGSEVVRGIIMREILGSPVSMREDYMR